MSIVSAMLPKMSLFKDLQSENNHLMEIWYDLDGQQPLNKRKVGFVIAKDLKAMEKENKCRTGIEFMNEVKSLLDERRHTLVTAGKKIAGKKNPFSDFAFDWEIRI